MEARAVTVNTRETAGASLLSERLADANLDPQLMLEVKALERIALWRSLQVSSNGKSPRHWTVERWMAVLTFAMAVIGTVFVFGSDWQGVKRDVAGVKEDVNSIRVDLVSMRAVQTDGQFKLDALKTQIGTLERDAERAPRPIATPQFGRP